MIFWLTSAHSNSNITFFQGRGIVNAIPGHGNDMPSFLALFHNQKLLFGSRSGKDQVVIWEELIPFFISQLRNSFAMDCIPIARKSGLKNIILNRKNQFFVFLWSYKKAYHVFDKTYLSSNSISSQMMIARNHKDFNTRCFAIFNCLSSFISKNGELGA